MRLAKRKAAPNVGGAAYVTRMEALDDKIYTENTDQLQAALLAEVAEWRQRRVAFPTYGMAAR